MEVLGIAVPTSSETLEPSAGIWISNHLMDLLNLGRCYGSEGGTKLYAMPSGSPVDAQVLFWLTNAIREW